MNKTTMWIGMIVLVAVAIGAWLLVGNSPAPQTAPSANTGAATPPPDTTTGGLGSPETPPPQAESKVLRSEKDFTVAAQNYSFVPSVMAVKVGDTVKITLQNTGGFHDLVIDAFGAATKRIQGGQSDTITFVADKAGTFEYYCSVDGHRAMGMKGTLTVAE